MAGDGGESPPACGGSADGLVDGEELGLIEVAACGIDDISLLPDESAGKSGVLGDQYAGHAISGSSLDVARSAGTGIAIWPAARGAPIAWMAATRLGLPAMPGWATRKASSCS